MYLRCPRCHTVYAVRATMLREGQGEVRCGACRIVFNGLDYLSDELPTHARDATPVPSDGPAAQAPVDASVVHETAPRSTSLSRRGRAGNPVPSALWADLEGMQAGGVARTRQVGLWLAAIVLLLALATQYAWFAPEDVARRFPMLAEPVQQFCLAAGCATRAERAPERIRIVSRDVRAHPRYEGALLITATFTNGAPWPQPFPRLQFSLYDVNGETVASRVLDPHEYLGGVFPADAPMASGQPVQVSLEMLAPEEAAVSFEFTFL